MCYLDASVRRRSNLTIVTTAQACMHLLLDGRRVTGVRALVDGEERDFLAREVILCAGAIFSPALLMRSGIGPAGASARAGHRAARRPARRRPQSHEPSGAVLRSPAAPGGATAGQPAHAAGVLFPPVVGIARLPGNRSLHQRAEQIVMERDRPADRQFRPRVVEAVFARPRLARLAGSVPPAPRRVQFPRRRARSATPDARLPLGGRLAVIRSGAPAAAAGRFRCASPTACAASTG